jgi:uncharacterized protein (TIGR00369 family)
MKNQKFDKLVQFLKETYEKMVPFHNVLKLQVISLEEDNVCMKIEMRKELFGNYRYGMLHGGAIASILDATSSSIVSLGLAKKIIDKPFEEIKERIFKIGTIDLRIDYLEPGQGNYFMATGSLLRIGNKVASAQTYLRNDKDILIAAGTGTYMLSK